MGNQHKFKTEISVMIAGIERDWPALIIYARYAGYAGSSIEPPEPASVEIIDIKLLGTYGVQIDLPAKIVDQFCEDESLMALLMDDWMNDEIAAQETILESRLCL